MRELLILFAVVTIALADIFTSTAHMQGLMDAEKDIPQIINEYILSEKNRLQRLKKYAEECERRNERVIQKGLESISNPINAFLLIKQLTGDWKRVVSLMQNTDAERFLHNVTQVRESSHYRYPTAEDLSGAAIGLLRLQDTYRLETKDIANGRLKNSKKTTELTANDCFEIGRSAYVTEDYYHTIMWMQEAKDRVEKEDPPTASIEDILEYLGFSLYKQGNLKHALRLTEELYRIAPEHPRAKGNVKWYEDLLEEEGVRRSDFRRNIPAIRNPRGVDDLDNSERTIFEALCRNEVPVSVKSTSQLYCYRKMDRPYLRLAPFNVEIVRLNPLAVLFRNVISDDEVEVIQMLATPKLNRATVQNAVTGGLETASYRISKSAWLKDYDHPVIETVNRRIDMMTNLEQQTSEDLQIANYGVGGHYDPHFDFARKEEPKAFDSLGTGNRIATVLFYLTEPEAGGGTVFTELKTAVMPSKNDALFWYNLHRTGDGDMRTRHAACPVLTGVKWVANKWIHEIGQEFRRPCALRKSINERYVGDLGAPEPRNFPNIKSF